MKTYLWEQLNDIQQIIVQQSALSNSIWLAGWDIANPEGIGKHRVETLTDGVFAIVMTLLVLEIAVPHLSESNVANELFCSPSVPHSSSLHLLKPLLYRQN
jgi:hypothetical protein